MKVVVSFDEQATDRQIEIYNRFVAEMAESEAYVDSIGGGIKNPK